MEAKLQLPETKLALIDHSFHRESNATFFLIDLLKKHYDVKIFWDEAWNGGPKVNLKEISNQGFDTIISFQQTHFSEKELKEIADKNLILIPMFDDSREFPDEFWKKFKHVKIINFSKRFHSKLKRLGLMSKYFQYFPSPHDFPQSKVNDKKLSGFFWQRTEKITWNHIKELIKKSGFKKIHIHGAMDPPGYPLVLPSEDEKKRYNITITKWFSEREDYFKILNASTVYFAPRMYEGIGMSFLEAMAMGKCVAAPDNPTMNEYIIHGKTGLLYDPNNLKPLDFSNIEQICINSQKYIKKGYKKWLKSQKKMIDFIKKPIFKPAFYRLQPFKVPFVIKKKILELFEGLGKSIG